MTKSRFTPKQIVAILEECDSGEPVSEVCCDYGISQPAVQLAEEV